MTEQSDAIAELLTLTVEVNKQGARIYRNSLGQLHRQYGPAVIYYNGTTYWCLNDQIHRVDGPAIEWANGDKSWWLNGEPFTEKEFHDGFE